MSMPGYRDRLKSTIVRIAREILLSDGLEGLQARRVASLSDCSVGTIYNLFGNLDMVIIAANAETLLELKADLLRAKNDAQPLDEQLSALATTYLNFALTRTPAWRALFEHRLSSNKMIVPAWYLESQAELFAIVEDILAKAIRSPQERKEAARALFSAVHGVISIAMDQKLGEFDEGATKRQVKFIVESVARGLDDRSA